MTTTIPADAIRIAIARTSDYATLPTLVDRAIIAAARPELADDMRVGQLSVYIDAPAAGYDPDTMPDTRRAYIEMREHTDALSPESTVTRLVDTPITDIEREIAAMRDRGAIPGYLAASVLADLSATGAVVED